jgi:hypothetical protein
MARQNIRWADHKEYLIACKVDINTADVIEMDKIKFMLYYLSLDVSVNVFSTAKQEWFLAASRLLAHHAPQVYDDQRSYKNSLWDEELDRIHLENALKFFCPEGFEYKTKDKRIGYFK